MSNYKMFNYDDVNGGYWMDPCDCNIHIKDANGWWRRLDPWNCEVKFLNACGQWETIECCTCPPGYTKNSVTKKCEKCTCPAGYIWNNNTNKCELITLSPATPSGGATTTIDRGNRFCSYNNFGAVLYEDISSKVFPLALNGANTFGTYAIKENNGAGSSIIRQEWTNKTGTFNHPIFSSNGQSPGDSDHCGVDGPYKGRLNLVSIGSSLYADPPPHYWMDTSYCLTLTETKTYIFCLAGDNNVKASITSTTFNGGGTTNLVNLISISSSTIPFNVWHMFPITLPAGTHTLMLSGKNNGNEFGFGAEIYDITVTDLKALMNSNTVTVADLEPHIIFSTKDLLTTPPLVIAAPGETITWSCGVGDVDYCHGAPSCTTITQADCTIDQVNCA